MIEKRYQISVIIPVYNVEKYVEKCLASVLRQTFRNFELILVDDCGTDHSMFVVEKLLHGEFPNGCPDWIRILHNSHNMGAGPSRNNGMDVASGEYIAFIDSDDYITEDYLNALYLAANENDADIVFCGYQEVEPEGKPIRSVKLDCANAETERFRILMPCAHLYRRGFLLRHQARFPNVFSEDIVFNLSIICFAARTAIIPDTGYCYVKRQDSITHSGNGYYIERNFPFHELSDMLLKAKNDGVRKEVYVQLEFETVKCYAATMLCYMRRCNKKRLDSHTDTVKECLDAAAPRCYRNPYLPITAIPSLPLMARVGTYLFAKAYQFHCLRRFVWFVTRF